MVCDFAYLTTTGGLNLVWSGFGLELLVWGFSYLVVVMIWWVCCFDSVSCWLEGFDNFDFFEFFRG